MTERLRRAVELDERSAGELEQAGVHARAAAAEALKEVARLHAAASRLPGEEADG